MTPVVILAATALVVLLALATACGWLLNHLLANTAVERASWADERAWLLQRIQAPQTAVAQFDPADDEPEPDPEPSEEESRVFHSEQDEILHQLGRL